jgi:DNA-binding XRE family transcriptional regulator
MRYTILHSENGHIYRIPLDIAKKYEYKAKSVNKKLAKELFATIEQKYTKVGVLLRGTRHREGLTQAEMAKKINIRQADLSKMENGKRPIGKIIAKRIEEIFSVDYRYFL